MGVRGVFSSLSLSKGRIQNLICVICEICGSIKIESVQSVVK